MNRKTFVGIALTVCAFNVAALGWSKNEKAGFCAAYQMTSNNTQLAKIAMNMATNKGEMQAAARSWVQAANQDIGTAVRRGIMACESLNLR